MKKEILDHLGKMHASHIHARGKTASAKIIELLDCRAGEDILEVGFGTGATLAALAALHKKTKFYGIESSVLMLNKASQRIRFCQVQKNTKLMLAPEKLRFPCHDDAFDKVFFESVAAIQEENDLVQFLTETRRILKPGGILILNETIWMDSTDSVTAKKINEACKEAFGIIQSNAQIIHLADWELLLTENRFGIKIKMHVGLIRQITKQRFIPIHHSLSNAFTLYGKIKFRLNPTLTKEWKAHCNSMKQIIPDGQKLMEGVIIMAVNHKNQMQTPN